MASLPLLHPSPSLIHHSSSSSSDRIKKPYFFYFSGYSSFLRSPPSTTILRVSQTLTNPSSRFLESSSFKKKEKEESSRFICRASSSSNQSSDRVPAQDRLLSAMAYLLPFFNGLNFGVFVFDRFPIVELAFTPFVPLFSFYKSVPGANFMLFLALCFGVVRDRGFSRYVRRNALQATMLDVLLALPSLVNIVFDSNKGLKFQLLELSYGVTFLVVVIGFLYAFGFSLMGRNPRFPFVSDAVDWQLSAVDRQ